MHDIHVAVAKNYSENLKEEVKKGMREKAEQGVYPARAPIGYRNNPLTRAIDIDPERAPIVKRIFEMYGSGNYSLTTLRKAVLNELGVRINRAYLETILKSRFYLGYFVWQGVEYKGVHSPIISPVSFAAAQSVFTRRNKPKYRKHNFPFAGMLTCAHDDCTVTAEMQKQKYIYYRCSNGRGKCSLPYMREQDLSDRLGDILKDLYVPETVAKTIVDSLQADSDRSKASRQQRIAEVQQRLSALRTRMDQMYEDKLDGKIDEEFWARKMNEWREQERTLESQLSALSSPATGDFVLDAQRIFELAHRAHFLYLTRSSAERAELLKSVLLNCSTDGTSLWPTYRKPFDLIFERAKNQEWSGRADLNCRPLAPQASALPG